MKIISMKRQTMKTNYFQKYLGGIVIILFCAAINIHAGGGGGGGGRGGGGGGFGGGGGGGGGGGRGGGGGGGGGRGSNTGRKYNLSLGLQVLNLFNEVPCGSPVSGLSNPRFGQTTSVGGGFGGGSAIRHITLTANFNF